MNLRKAGFWGAGTLVFLVIAGAVALKILVDPARLKELASDKARQLLHRDLKVAQIQFELLPLPSVRIRDLELLHESEPPIKARAIIVGLRLLPLLIGQARYKSFELSEATVEWDGTPWRIEEAIVDAEEDMRDVKIVGRISRDGRAVAVTATVADLTQAGKQGATSAAKVELDWGATKLTAQGKVPVDGSPRNFDLAVEAKSAALEDVSAFFGWTRKPRAPFSATFAARDAEGRVSIEKIDMQLGQLRVRGDAQHTPGPRPFTALRLATDRLDWAKASYDVGNPNVAPPVAPQMFRDTPLAWWMVSGLAGRKGTVDATFGTLVLRNGVQMKNLRMKAVYDGDRFDITRWDSEMLGGTASGRIVLDGGRKAVAFDLTGDKLLLERWFRERGTAVKFSGGPMKVSAKVRTSGESMRQLVAAIDGPIEIRMGPGTLLNPRAGAAEAKLTGAGSDEQVRDVKFECVGYALAFRGGKAQGDDIIGARTDQSHLLTSGWVDMDAQAIDLRGRLKGTSGVHLAAILGDVKITGPIRTPKMQLDTAAAPKSIARGVAAIATLGLSAVATAAADAREARTNDPCEAVFRKR